MHGACVWYVLDGALQWVRGAGWSNTARANLGCGNRRRVANPEIIEEVHGRVRRMHMSGLG
jgi:hypothetical protein